MSEACGSIWTCISDLTWWATTAKFAPIGTATIAGIAAIIALRSLRLQRSIARKRAALDLFLKTELDSGMVKAHDSFLSTVTKLKRSQNNVSELSDEDRTAISNYLNIHELIAMGIVNGVLDETVCYEFWANELIMGYRNAKPLITYVREIDMKNNLFLYYETERLYRKWRRRHAKDFMEAIKVTKLPATKKPAQTAPVQAEPARAGPAQTKPTQRRRINRRYRRALSLARNAKRQSLSTLSGANGTQNLPDAT